MTISNDNQRLPTGERGRGKKKKKGAPRAERWAEFASRKSLRIATGSKTSCRVPPCGSAGFGVRERKRRGDEGRPCVQVPAEIRTEKGCLLSLERFGA